MSHECNKYIIHKGQFVRDFDRMYREIPDPWNQKSEASVDIMNHVLLAMLKLILPGLFEKKKKIEIMDIGSGPGHLTPFLIKLANVKDNCYVGTDISSEAIGQACANSCQKSEYLVDDIRVKNHLFINRFDLIFCAKTLYYVAPEIETVLNNIKLYGKKNSVFCFTYDLTKDSFSKKFLDIQDLRKKLYYIYKELFFIEIKRDHNECLNIGIYEKI